MDENGGTRDDIEGGFDLTDTNGVSNSVGIKNNAAGFLATSSEYLSNSSYSNTFHQSDFTVACWIKVIHDNSTAHGYVIGQAATATDLHFALHVEHFTTYSAIRGTMVNAAGTAFTATAENNIEDDDWHLGVFVRTGDDLVIWIDGVEGTTSPAVFSGTEVSNDLDLTMGRRDDGEYFTGKADEAAIWTRALSGADISQLYNSGAGITHPDIPTPVSLVTDLTNWWSLDESSGTRVDSHGAFNLTDNNTVGSVTGKVSNAADFIPANSEFLSNAAFSNVWHQSDFTIALWIKLDDPTSIQYAISQYTGAGAARHFYLTWNPTLNYWNFVMRNSAGSSKQSVSVADIGDDTNWHFIVVTRVVDTIYVYVDGIDPPIPQDFSGTEIGADVDLEIGKALTNYFDGKIDEVAIWERVLDADERAVLYNSGTGIAYPS
tara:strand:- start:21782 stop:23080 length:1299 start_codon:yes stop_codon:yes gene_type:complete